MLFKDNEQNNVHLYDCWYKEWSTGRLLTNHVLCLCITPKVKNGTMTMEQSTKSCLSFNSITLLAWQTTSAVSDYKAGRQAGRCLRCLPETEMIHVKEDYALYLASQFLIHWQVARYWNTTFLLAPRVRYGVSSPLGKMFWFIES